MKVAILIADSNGCFPVPAVKDGAVATLVQHLIDSNEIEQCAELTIISYWSKEAEEVSHKYSKSRFIWIKRPRIIEKLDDILFFVIQKSLGNRKIVSYRSMFSLFFFIYKASRILRKNIFDSVVIENNIPLIWTIRLSQYRGKYYYHLHNVPRINAFCKKEFKKCDGFLCVSSFIAEQIKTDKNPIGPIESQKIKVLYNCVDINQFKYTKNIDEKENLKRKYNIPYENKIVIFVGRLSAEKGIDKVLDALITMRRKDITLLIVGSLMHNLDIEDEYQCRLHNCANQLGTNVKFTGYIPQRELYKYYNMADVAVLPSVWEEPAGLTMVEALACGLPVVTTNSGGIAEYVSGIAFVLEKNDMLIDNIGKTIELALLGTEEDKIKRVEYIESRFNSKFYIVNFCRLLNQMTDI